jgi:2-keto-3-deoxy-L-fuconate dehydrogenase
MFGEPIARINGLLRVVFITGGASGIGAACAVRFLRGGWRVSLLDLNDVPGPVSENVLAIHGDVTVEATRQTAVQRTLDRLGRIDAVIHSAGIGLYRTCLHTEPDHLKQIFETNFVAPWRLSQLVLPVIRKSGSGTIVNIGSVAGEVSLPWAAAYSASKSATHSMMESMRRELVL